MKMTGKEILQAEFDRAGKHGYMADQVDTLLQQIAAFVDEQESAKEDLTYKIQILADKIEEYKKERERTRFQVAFCPSVGAYRQGIAACLPPCGEIRRSNTCLLYTSRCV